MQGARMPGNRQCMQKKYSESSLYAEKILGIVNVHRKNTRNRQCKVQECSETTMYAEKILGIVNAR